MKEEMQKLYDHRAVLFIALCVMLDENTVFNVWKSKLHYDGTFHEGFFIMGFVDDMGEKATYHIELKYWNLAKQIRTLDKGEKFDGHTSEDVLEILKKLCTMYI